MERRTVNETLNRIAVLSCVHRNYIIKYYFRYRKPYRYCIYLISVLEEGLKKIAENLLLNKTFKNIFITN